MARFLILQLRPETDAADSEYRAILSKSGLTEAETVRVRLDRADAPVSSSLHRFAGVIVGGGPGCVSDDPTKKPPLEAKMEAAVLSLMPVITQNDIPFMGCCAGIGLLAHHLGGSVSKDRYGEAIGASTCEITEAGRSDPLLAGLPERFDAFVGHKEALQHLPEGCRHLLSSAPCPFQMIRHGQNVYATQFHPEADAQEFETRIRIYKDHGYFPPEDADRLIAMCQAADVSIPEELLSRFVEKYR